MGPHRIGAVVKSQSHVLGVQGSRLGKAGKRDTYVRRHDSSLKLWRCERESRLSPTR